MYIGPMQPYDLRFQEKDQATPEGEYRGPHWRKWGLYIRAENLLSYRYNNYSIKTVIEDRPLQSAHLVKNGDYPRYLNSPAEDSPPPSSSSWDVLDYAGTTTLSLGRRIVKITAPNINAARNRK